MSGLLARYLLTMMVLHMAAIPFSAEEIALAQIIQGEAYHGFMRDDGAAAYAVGMVARNRLESGRYGSSYKEVQSGFSGTLAVEPERRYLAVARKVINGTEDPTQGALYVLSQQDVKVLGFGDQAALITLVLRTSETRALYFYKTWPED